MRRYQIRLKSAESMDLLLESLADSILRHLVHYPEWGVGAPESIRHLRWALQRVFGGHVRSYDSCGSRAECFVSAEPASWNVAPDFLLEDPGSREAVRILQLEVKEGLEEFLRALETAVVGMLDGETMGSEMAYEIRVGLCGVIKEILGPHLFRRSDQKCDSCVSIGRPRKWLFRCRSSEAKNTENSNFRPMERDRDVRGLPSSLSPGTFLDAFPVRLRCCPG